MGESSRFHLGDILSITTKALLSPDLLDGVYRIIDHVTGVPHMTHQLTRASREIKPFLLEQFPQLVGVEPPDGADVPELISWLSWAVSEYGEYHDVVPMPFGQYVGREPLAEWREIRPDAPIISLDDGDD